MLADCSANKILIMNYFYIAFYMLNLYIYSNYDIFDELYSLALTSAVMYYMLIFVDNQYILIDRNISSILLQTFFFHLFFQPILFTFALIYLLVYFVYFLFFLQTINSSFSHHFLPALFIVRLIVIFWLWFIFLLCFLLLRFTVLSIWRFMA